MRNNEIKNIAATFFPRLGNSYADEEISLSSLFCTREWRVSIRRRNGRTTKMENTNISLSAVLCVYKCFAESCVPFSFSSIIFFRPFLFILFFSSNFDGFWVTWVLYLSTKCIKISAFYFIINPIFFYFIFFYY